MKHPVNKTRTGALVPGRQEISVRAYELWNARGRPDGSPDEDWLQAEADLMQEAALHAPMKGVMKERGTVEA